MMQARISPPRSYVPYERYTKTLDAEHCLSNLIKRAAYILFLVIIARCAVCFNCLLLCRGHWTLQELGFNNGELGTLTDTAIFQLVPNLLHTHKL